MPSKPFILAFLAALLLAASSAPAASAAPSATPFAAAAGELEVGDEVAEEGEEEFEESECEEAIAEFDEGEIRGEERDEICQEEKREKEKAAAAGILPEECVVRTFLSTAVASRNEVQLTIYYTAYESTAATIDFGLGGSHLGTAKRRLGTQGVIHLAEHLSDSLSAKVQSAHKITVQVSVPEATAGCAQYFSNDLTAKHPSKSRTTFLPRPKRS